MILTFYRLNNNFLAYFYFQNFICFFLIIKIKAPAQSPDLNPIEYVWADLKSYVRKTKCSSLLEISRAIAEYRKTLTPRKCATFIESLKKVLEIFFIT